METSLLSYALGQAGVLDYARVDAEHRAREVLGDTVPSLEELTTWCTTLRQTAPHLFTPAPAAPPPSQRSTLEAVAAKHGMTVEQWEMIGHLERMTRERVWEAQHGQAPGPKQKTSNYIATGEELKSLTDKSLNERLTMGHERTQQQKG